MASLEGEKAHIVVPGMEFDVARHRPVVLASRNAHKVEEMRRLLQAAGLPLDLVGLDSHPEVPEVQETGSTFAANALIKARAVVGATGCAAIADDSGICVDALNGMPGVLSARWAGQHGDDAANVALLLNQLRDVPASRRGAHFACAVALVVPARDGSTIERVVEGFVEGRIIGQMRGTNGFGYDPVFVPVGMERTTAELTDAEKDGLSHRGQAMRALVPVLSEMISGIGHR